MSFSTRAWELTRELFANTCTIAFGLWSVFCFYMILTKGRVAFVEHRTWIAISELALSLLVIVLGIERTVKDFLHIGKKP